MIFNHSPIVGVKNGRLVAISNFIAKLLHQKILTNAKSFGIVAQYFLEENKKFF